ncbi:MAG: prepilin-type N-terminal cleavage/methylation domain-containing protein [Phycisphaera sp.]|nr:MAG: prepilin-type N-terminal cleavage/methylation domain-containing protein [Phycisphaera sp.]
MNRFDLRRRGLTLIEVLLAVTLLAMLTTISVGILRDAGNARARDDTPNRFDETTRQVNLILTKHSRTVWELAPGQRWTPPAESLPVDITISFTREPCDDCPEGWGRIEITADEFSLTRFYEFKPVEEQNP